MTGWTAAAAAALAALVASPERPAAPGAVTIATQRGETTVPVRLEHGHPALAAARLAAVLPLELATEADWAVVSFGGRPFRFLLDAPVLVDRGALIPLVGGAYLSGDSLFVPLQWLADYVPRVLSEAYRYDPLAYRFEEARLAPVIAVEPSAALSPAAGAKAPAAGPLGGASVSSGPAAPRPAAAAAASGGRLRQAHTVVIDPGHGGNDPGNPGLAFPRGVQEKDVTLALARRLKEELEGRGVRALLTRTGDVRIDLRERARMCARHCDAFVSIHVNSVPRRRGYQEAAGFETYFLDEARTAEAQRVAAMENDALRYEADVTASRDNQFSFILKDLQANEYLRESAALAEAVQRHGARVHPGGSRGVSQARFVVLGTAKSPAILVETGFSTNPTDARFLVSPEGQRRLARAIAEGIVEYLAQYEQKVAGGQPQ